MRYFVVNGAGVIVRSGDAPNPAAQAGSGETAYTLSGPGPVNIPDQSIGFSAGSFTSLNGYSGDYPPGTVTAAEIS